MNAQIYNIILEDSANIAGFFRDQPGGELCLALFIEICQSIIEKGNTVVLECVIDILFTTCETPKRWKNTAGNEAEFFVDMLETQFTTLGK